METLWNQRNALNWCLLTSLPLKWLRDILPPIWHAQADIFLACFAVGLWLWIAAVAWWRYRHASTEAMPYDRLSTGDYMRWFFGMLVGWYPLAIKYTFGFLIATAVALLTTLVAVCIIGVELYRARNSVLRREESTLGVGMAVFVYFLCCGELNALRIHFGVPIPGHFLESPSYDMVCDATAKRLNENFDEIGAALPVRATVHVSSFEDTESVGEDRFGQEHWVSTEVRTYIIRTFRFANGRVLKIANQHDLVERLNDAFYLDDVNGNVWVVNLKKTNN
jgi:hypothetical protein